MSDIDPSNTLGRLVAAERNAMAAINLAKQNAELLGKVELRCESLAASNVELQSQVSALNARIYKMMGTGSTETG